MLPIVVTTLIIVTNMQFPYFDYFFFLIHRVFVFFSSLSLSLTSASRKACQFNMLVPQHKGLELQVEPGGAG